MDGEGFLGGFLAGRGERTRQAYATDIEDFARFLDQPAEAAVGMLLGGGPVTARRLVLDYAVALHRAGRAPATVGRRLGTLRTLAREAHRARIVDWLLDIPDDRDVAAAIDERATSARYLFPRHPGEIDRLDVQHYALREALDANHLAPIDAPERVLDTGCGTGQWGFDMCAQYPGARVVGVDLVPGKPERPSRYAFVKADLLRGLPFVAGRFDYVHQRFLVAGIPLVSWPDVVADLVRTTRPGGWVELVEARLILEPAGPATTRLLAMVMGMARKLGLDTGRAVADAVDGYLRGAGLTAVERREIPLPVGVWGGRVGELMATDIRAGFTRTCEVLHRMSQLSIEEGMDLVQQLMAELEEHRTTIMCAIAYGRKP